MAIYLIIAIIIFVGSIAERNESRVIYRISLLSLFLFTALRSVDLGGWDAQIYQNYFDIVPPVKNLSNAPSGYPMGYLLLNSIVKSFSGNYVIYQIIYALISIALLAFLIDKMGVSFNERCLFLFGYFCYRFIWNNWIVLRQNIADLIFWILLLYIDREKCKKKKIVLYFCAVLIPTLFHTAAWMNSILLLCVFFLKKVNCKFKLHTIPIISMFLLLFGSELYNTLLRILINYVDIRYEMYLVQDVRGINIINWIFRMCFYILFMRYYNRQNIITCDDENKQVNCISNELVANTFTVMVLLGSINAELMTRAYEFYAIGLYTSFAHFPRFFKHGKSRWLAAIVYFCIMILLLYRFLTITDDGAYANYSFWFLE